MLCRTKVHQYELCSLTLFNVVVPILRYKVKENLKYIILICHSLAVASMDETFRTFHRVLALAGISFFSEGKKHSKQWLLFQIFNFLLSSLTLIFTSVFVIAHSSDLPLFIQGTCIWTTGVIMFISLGVCLIFREEFHMFLSEMVFEDGMLEMPMIEYVLKNNHEGKLNDLKMLVQNTQEKLLRSTTMLLKIYVASVWLCATLYLCSPIYQMFMSENASLRLLAFDMWFPWSLDNFKIYVGSFIFHAYAGYLCCVAYPGLQSTIILLVGQTIRQLRIITFVLQNLNELSTQLVGEISGNWQSCSTEIFSQCVRHYVKIKRFTNRLNGICQPFYLALILVAIMLVCMCSVKIAVSSSFSPDITKYFVHELCFILVVFMFCLLGQQVEDECEQLEQAVTEKWYLFDRRHKINIMIFKLAVSQRMPIYIFGTITLSLPTFTWFIKSGMSFFTLVMSVLEG